MEDIKKYWHTGKKTPLDKKWIVMINTYGKVLGQYDAEINKVRVWTKRGWEDYNFTPKCRWIYLDKVEGKNVELWTWGDGKLNKKIIE